MNDATEDKKSWTYTPKTDDELKRIALDINKGLVFTDKHIREGDERLFGSIFMIYSLMDAEQLEALKSAEIVTAFEYLEKAASNGVNGYPSFFSLQMLNRTDAEKMWRYYFKLQEAEAAALASL